MSAAVSSQETKPQLALSSPAQKQENHVPKHILTPSTLPGLTCLLVRCGSLLEPLQEPQISPGKVPPAPQLLQQTRSDTVLVDGRRGEAPVTMQSCRHCTYILHGPLGPSHHSDYRDRRPRPMSPAQCHEQRQPFQRRARSMGLPAKPWRAG